MSVTEKAKKLVSVFLVTVDPESEETLTEEKEIPRGNTPVTQLKEELGVAAELALWVIRKNGRKKQLADHTTHNVKADERFEVIHPGGIS